MSIVEQMQKCNSPSDALIMLAKAVESQEQRIIELEQATASGWDEWSAATPPAAESLSSDVEPTWRVPGSVIAEIEKLKDELHGNEDDAESKALRARIYLLEDEIKPPAEHIDLEQSRSVQSVQNGDVTVDLPMVSLDEEDEREKFARFVLKLPEYYGDSGEEYVKSYRKGGPLLLYYSHRDMVMSQPTDVKQAMIADVERLSPNEAAEMGRDLLKDMEAGGPEVSVQNLIKTMGT